MKQKQIFFNKEFKIIHLVTKQLLQPNKNMKKFQKGFHK